MSYLPAIQPNSFWSIVLLAVLSLCLRNCRAQDTTYESSLDLRDLHDFRLLARIRHIRAAASQIDSDLMVSEYYSNEQQRGRVDIKIISVQARSSDRGAQKISHYFDSDGDRMLRLTKDQYGSKNCEKGNQKKLVDDLFGRLAWLDGSVEVKDWLKVREQIPSHVIGLARFIMLVEAYRREGRLELDSDAGSRIRNHMVNRYKMKTDFGADSTGNPSSMVAYYNKLGAGKPQGDFPLRIWVQLAGGAELIIDFALVGPISGSGSPPQWVNSNSGYLDSVIDILTFPVGFGCAQSIKPMTSSQDNSTLDRASQVFSFRAEIFRHWNSDTGPRPSSEGHVFVAYDGFARVLRRDSWRRQQTSLGASGDFAREDYKVTIRS